LTELNNLRINQLTNLFDSIIQTILSEPHIRNLIMKEEKETDKLFCYVWCQMDMNHTI